MLYMPSWNGLVEGPTWDAWWIQNSYGPTYSVLPFLQEPFVTFLQNSQDLWFDQMGDGKRVGAPPPFNWVAPDGCLCDAARPGWIVYRQGDGRPHIHDWGMEFTAAGLLLQSELLLIGRDTQALAKYLPRLERCANFIETRRDPTNNLFLAGPAGNLLAPSFAGWKKADGTYGKAYLTGLSVTYIAALDRLTELEKLAGRPAEAQLQTDRCDSEKKRFGITDDGRGLLDKLPGPGRNTARRLRSGTTRLLRELSQSRRYRISGGGTGAGRADLRKDCLNPRTATARIHSAEFSIL
jgi:hypothetical protein